MLSKRRTGLETTGKREYHLAAGVSRGRGARRDQTRSGQRRSGPGLLGAARQRGGGLYHQSGAGRPHPHRSRESAGRAGPGGHPQQRQCQCLHRGAGAGGRSPHVPTDGRELESGAGRGAGVLHRRDRCPPAHGGDRGGYPRGGESALRGGRARCGRGHHDHGYGPQELCRGVRTGQSDDPHRRDGQRFGHDRSQHGHHALGHHRGRGRGTGALAGDVGPGGSALLQLHHGRWRHEHQRHGDRPGQRGCRRAATGRGEH